MIPVLSSLTRNGFDVDLFIESLDGRRPTGLEDSLRSCSAAVAWCAELNPGVQIAGLVSFLGLAAELNPAAPRLTGGGFFTFVNSDTGFDVDPLAHRIVPDSGIGSLPDAITQLLSDSDRATDQAASQFDCSVMHELDLQPFLNPEWFLFGTGERALQIPTGYGCGKKCSFCFYEQTHPKFLRAEELVSLVTRIRTEYGVKQFLFGELDFFASRSRAVRVAQGLLDQDADVRWFALVSAQDIERLSDEDLDVIARSGCHILEIGTEVGSDGAMDRIGKKLTVEIAIEQSRRLIQRGIVPLHNMMFGFVGETAHDRRDTLRIIKRLRRLHPAVQFTFRVYQAVPATTMGDEALRLLPAIPKNLNDLASFRFELRDGRGMPWLEAREEREVKFLTEYILPLAYDDPQKVHRPTLLRRALRLAAEARCALGYLRAPWDRAVFRRFEKAPLCGTFSP
ncbi:MAG: hypothetical protein CMJ83_00795 [Planctomycetes bacterium]|nr:hypothetical protein [Planctomycetota bacterium]